jgi:hypothetical protein
VVTVGGDGGGDGGWFKCVLCDKQEKGIIKIIYYAVPLLLVWLSWLECCIYFQLVMGSNPVNDILKLFFG